MIDLRKVDRLIAESVMGWTEHRIGKVGSEYWYPEGTTPRTPPFQAGAVLVELFTPASDIAMAWQVIQELGSYLFDIKQFSDGWQVGYCLSTGWRKNETSHVFADSAPLAICLAALKARGVELPAQSAGTTSDSTQSPADPDDSAPSVRAESEGPGSC